MFFFLPWAEQYPIFSGRSTWTLFEQSLVLNRDRNTLKVITKGRAWSQTFLTYHYQHRIAIHGGTVSHLKRKGCLFKGQSACYENSPEVRSYVKYIYMYYFSQTHSVFFCKIFMKTFSFWMKWCHLMSCCFLFFWSKYCFGILNITTVVPRHKNSVPGKMYLGRKC